MENIQQSSDEKDGDIEKEKENTEDGQRTEFEQRLDVSTRE